MRISGEWLPQQWIESEMDLLDLVAKNYWKLGFVGILEFNRSSGFPDFTFIDRDGNLVKVEVETKMSHFSEHYHHINFEAVLDYQAIAYWEKDEYIGPRIPAYRGIETNRSEKQAWKVTSKQMLPSHFFV